MWQKRDFGINSGMIVVIALDATAGIISWAALSQSVSTGSTVYKPSGDGKAALSTQRSFCILFHVLILNLDKLTSLKMFAYLGTLFCYPCQSFYTSIGQWKYGETWDPASSGELILRRSQMAYDLIKEWVMTPSLGLVPIGLIILFFIWLRHLGARQAQARFETFGPQRKSFSSKMFQPE